MGSSSDVEIVERRPPSPPKPRRGGRARRAPRGVDELAAPAAATLAHTAPMTKRARKSGGATSDEDLGGKSVLDSVQVDEVKVARPASPPQPVASTSKSPFARAEVITLSTSSVTLAARSSEPALTFSRLSPAPVPSSTTLPRASSTSTALNTASGGIKRPRSHTPKEIKPAVLKTSYSSDEADDFFVKKAPVRKGRAPKVVLDAQAKGAAKPAGRVPGGRKPGGAPSTSAAVKTSPVKGKAPFSDFSTDSKVENAKAKSRSKAIPSSDDSDSDSSVLHSDSSTVSPRKASPKKRGGVRENSLNKPLNLPDWALGGGSKARAGQSGADRAAAERGYKKNRRKRRLSVDSAEEKGREEEEEDPFDELDREEKGMEVDSDDSLELDIMSVTPRKKAPTATSARKKEKEKARRVAPDSSDEDEEDVAPTPRAAKSPRRPASVSSPFRPTPRRAPSASTFASLANPSAVITISSDSGSEPHIASSSRPFFSTHKALDDDAEPDLASILANVQRLKQSSAKPSSAAAAGAGRAPSQSVPFHPPFAFSSPEKGSLGGAGGEKGGTVTFVVNMVFDPTRQVPPIAKKAYERDETFVVGVNDTFSPLFYDLSLRRTIPTSNLVIYTSSAPSSSSASSRGRREVWEFGTPDSLGFKPGETVYLKGYTTDNWEKVREMERQNVLSGRSPAGGGGGGGEEMDDDDFELAAAAAAAAARAQAARSPSAAPRSSAAGTPAPAPLDFPSSSPDKDQGDAFPLTLRGSKTQSLSLAVKLSTTVAQLLKAYAKKHGLEAGKLWMEFEGDKLEGGRTLEDVKDEFELEGEETFEVKGAM
ncbi:hypothetical protein JCM8547_002974 [Rhodosporidiobolus lusitaniae]